MTVAILGLFITYFIGIATNSDTRQKLPSAKAVILGSLNLTHVESWLMRPSNPAIEQSDDTNYNKINNSSVEPVHNTIGVTHIRTPRALVLHRTLFVKGT